MQSRRGPDCSAIPNGPNSNRRCSRELLPLPHVEVSSCPGQKLSRKCRQRLGRRQHFEEEVNATVTSLNLMYGAGCVKRCGSGGTGFSEPSLAQLQSLEFIEHAITELGPPGELSGPEALEELRVSTGYEELPTSCPLASFDPDLVALPSEGMMPVPLESLWGEGGQLEVEEFYRKRLLGSDEIEVRLDECGVRRCYQDPKLNDPAVYAGFLKQLLELNLVDVSLSPPVEQVGLFFVKKKNNKMRLIMDCRRSNCYFSDPEHVQLATGEALARMNVAAGEQVFVASADLQNAFYTMSMPQHLRSLFGLRAVRAELLGLTHVEGQPVGPHTLVHCRVAVIPMGWKWALWWCQRVNERICERSGLLQQDRLQDGVASPNNGFWHVQYVDNLHVLGVDRAMVEQKFWCAVRGLREAGLTVHEIEFDEGQSKVLGWELEQTGILRPSRRRLWRLRLGIRELLKRGRASGQQIERLVGHITFVSLCRREALATLGECYSFIRQHYNKVVPLWKSVRRELVKWDGIAPLIFMDLMRPFNNKVYSVDASEWGLGVVCSTMTTEELSVLGGHYEKWRFRDEEARDARAYVLAEDDRLFSHSVCFPSEPTDRASKFLTVPFTAVTRDWKVVGRHPWRQRESMPVFEAMSSLYAIKHALRDTKQFGQRHVILTDSMTAAVSFDKGRSQSFRLRRVLERAGALMLCSGSSFRLRWIPSEWNPADSLSRGGWSPSLPVRRFGDDTPPLGGECHMGAECQTETQQGSSCVRQCAVGASAGPLDVGYRAGRREKSVEEGAQSCASEGISEKRPRQDSEKLLSRGSDSGQVSEALVSVEGLGRSSHQARVDTRCTGCYHRRLCRAPLSRRRRLECGKLSGGSSGLCQSTTEGCERLALDSAGPQGVEERVSTSQQNASAIRGGVPSCSAGSGAETAGDWPCVALSLHALLASGGAIQTEGSGCGFTYQEGGEPVQAFHDPLAPYRNWGSIKNKSMGRNAGIGPGPPWLSGSSDGFSFAAQTAVQDSPGLSSEPGASEPVHARQLEASWVDTLRASAYVSTSARRSLLRGSSPTEAASCNSASGKMAISEEREKLRERQQTPSAFRVSQQRNAAESTGRKKKRAQTFPCPALSKVVLHFCVFLEIFSGTGRLGTSVHRVTSWPVLLWDITLGEAYDLTKRVNQQRILHWLMSGKVRGGHLGTPCNSFSRARDQPGGPPPLRSDLRPLGLEGLKPHDSEKVRIGNCLACFSVRVMLLAMHLLIPFTLENPQRSRLCLVPFMLRLLRRRHVQVQDIEFCAFGTRWKKSTRFVSVCLPLDVLMQYRCIGSKRGICKFTGLPHLPLCGQDSKGAWLTKVAEPYPWKLTKVLAIAFSNVELCRTAMEFSRHLA